MSKGIILLFILYKGIGTHLKQIISRLLFFHYRIFSGSGSPQQTNKCNMIIFCYNFQANQARLFKVD